MISILKYKWYKYHKLNRLILIGLAALVHSIDGIGAFFQFMLLLVAVFGFDGRQKFMSVERFKKSLK